MKNYQKKLIIILNLVCLININNTGLPTFAVSATKTISSEQFNIRVTRENFAEFCDSLIIPDEKQKLKLDPLYFGNFDLLTGNYQSRDIFSVHNEKFQPNALRNLRKKQAEEENNDNSDSSTGIYNINLSKNKQSFQTINVDNDNRISTEPFMYSMIGVDEKNTSFNFEKAVEKVKMLVVQKDFSEATGALTFLRTKARGNNANLFIIAGLYEKINRPDEACGIYKEISDAEPLKYEYVYSYAVCLYKNNNNDLAEKLFLKTIELKPDFSYAYYNLGNLYYKQADYYKALDYFNKAMDINPASSDVCFNIAVTLEQLDHKTLAKKFYSKCLDLNPNDKQAESALERLE